ncbi:hypothetical protein EAX61_04090 [Dokdonia sinensis]|uniref:DUF4397 domain-containing protein n=1 Tax=Dokdonia sinensis TaxID=2479847 RepID=A0A3M0GD20_9FLAO|nr:hypothetical protein [Dokdonia sinensis]RMB62765.1 hypothetical protein EAX61_04090 [Dokdonia sinensis]
MRKILITTVILVYWISCLKAQNAEIQFIHNAADFNGIGGNVLSAFEYYTTLELEAPGFPDYSGQAVIMLLTGVEDPDAFENGESFDAYLLGPKGGNF